VHRQVVADGPTYGGSWGLGIGAASSSGMWASGQGRRVRGVVLRHLELEGRFGAVLTWDPVFIFSWRWISSPGGGRQTLFFFIGVWARRCG
jgi:hypothetical protein